MAEADSLKRLDEAIARMREYLTDVGTPLYLVGQELDPYTPEELAARNLRFSAKADAPPRTFYLDTGWRVEDVR